MELAALVRRVAPTSAIVLSALMLGGCGLSGYERMVGEGEYWWVGAMHPRYDSIDACTEDAQVSEALHSLDMPSSRLSLRLAAGATEEDALRIADCMVANLSAGDVWIQAPANS